ncbi:hypothetical protein BMF94_3996 [Rhodotorula taiwanensis]|uniref:Uncharacterized protein n=1 Tax=Rhodotorula taiwanensis TaxID=741276 RepID=A0A2S5B8A8_9BASI|nr:hypothetical protein BMF94_3996 [Rhodotorula taiwanensis]
MRFKLFALMSAALLPFRLIRHKRTFASTLRRTALSTFLVGPALGAGYAFVRLNSHSEEAIRESAARMRADKGERKREDYATIGGVLGALGTTTLLLRRAPLVWTLGSGASLGIAAGTLYSFLENSQTRPGGIKQEAKRVEGSVKGEGDGVASSLAGGLAALTGGAKSK